MMFPSTVNWHTEIAGNTLAQYSVAICIFIGLLCVLSVFQYFILQKIKRAAEMTATQIDDVAVQVIYSIRPPFYFILAGFISMNLLNVSEFVNEAVRIGIIVLLVYQTVQVSQIIINFIFRKHVLKERNADAKEAFVSINRLVSIVLWVFGGLVIAQNLGFNISSVLAGLGIGGVAIALASQAILSDLFSSLAIVLDKPFVPGDFIIVGQHMGVVQKVGIKTTRIKALQGEEIVISNAELTSTRVQNFKKLQERRVVFKIRLTYDAPKKTIEKLPLEIEKIIKNHKKARFDRAHLVEFGEHALNFEIVYYALTPEYNEYMDLHQEILFEIHSLVSSLKASFAYPTQSIILQKR